MSHGTTDARPPTLGTACGGMILIALHRIGSRFRCRNRANFRREREAVMMGGRENPASERVRSVSLYTTTRVSRASKATTTKQQRHRQLQEGRTIHLFVVYCSLHVGVSFQSRAFHSEWRRFPQTGEEWHQGEKSVSGAMGTEGACI